MRETDCMPNILPCNPKIPPGARTGDAVANRRWVGSHERALRDKSDSTSWVRATLVAHPPGLAQGSLLRMASAAAAADRDASIRNPGSSGWSGSSVARCDSSSEAGIESLRRRFTMLRSCRSQCHGRRHPRCSNGRQQASERANQDDGGDAARPRLDRDHDGPALGTGDQLATPVRAHDLDRKPAAGLPDERGDGDDQNVLHVLHALGGDVDLNGGGVEPARRFRVVETDVDRDGRANVRKVTNRTCVLARRQDSKLRPSAPEADALSTELQARDGSRAPIERGTR
jgi:hypothetical protein